MSYSRQTCTNKTQLAQRIIIDDLNSFYDKKRMDNEKRASAVKAATDESGMIKENTKVHVCMHTAKLGLKLAKWIGKENGRQFFREKGEMERQGSFSRSIETMSYG